MTLFTYQLTNTANDAQELVSLSLLPHAPLAEGFMVAATLTTPSGDVQGEMRASSVRVALESGPTFAGIVVAPGETISLSLDLDLVAHPEFDNMWGTQIAPYTRRVNPGSPIPIGGYISPAWSAELDLDGTPMLPKDFEISSRILRIPALDLAFLPGFTDAPPDSIPQKSQGTLIWVPWTPTPAGPPAPVDITLDIGELQPNEIRRLSVNVPSTRLYGVRVKLTGLNPGDVIETRLWGRDPAASTFNPDTDEMYYGLANAGNAWTDSAQQWRFRNLDGQGVMHIEARNAGQYATSYTLSIQTEQF